MKLNYKRILSDSWEKFKKNLILVIPSIIGVAITIGIFFVTGLIFMLMGISSEQIVSYDLLTTKNIVVLSLMIVFVFICMFLLNSFIRAMELGMMKDVASKGKTDINKMFSYGKEYFLKYLLTSLIVVLFVLPALVILILFSLIPVVGTPIGAFIAGVYLIVLFLYLFFVGPVIVSKEGTPLEMIKLSFDYSKRNMKHVLVTFGVSLVAMLIIMLPFVIIESLLTLGESYLIAFLLSIVVFARNIVNVLLSLVIRLFEFKAYLAKK